MVSRGKYSGLGRKSRTTGLIRSMTWIQEKQQKNKIAKAIRLRKIACFFIKTGFCFAKLVKFIALSKKILFFYLQIATNFILCSPNNN
jgi:hypothetical protein